MGCEVTNRIQKEAPAEEGKDLLSTHRANQPRKNELKLQEGLLRPSTRLANNKQKAFKNICWASLTVGRWVRQSLLAHPKGYIQSYNPMTSVWHLNFFNRVEESAVLELSNSLVLQHKSSWEPGWPWKGARSGSREAAEKERQKLPNGKLCQKR